MGLNTGDKLGKKLGENERNQKSTNENISPDDPSEQVVIGAITHLTLEADVKVIKKTPSEGAIAFDRLTGDYEEHGF